MDPAQIASEQAARFGLANIETARQAGDFFTPLARGLEFGTGLARQARQDTMAQEKHAEELQGMRLAREVETAKLHDLTTRMQLFDSQLGLAAKKASVELGIAEAQLRSEQIKSEMAAARQKRESEPGVEPFSDTQKTPPWQDEQGNWWAFMPIGGGMSRAIKISEDDWRVRELKAAVGRDQAYAALSAAREQREVSTAGWMDRRPGEGGDSPSENASLLNARRGVLERAEDDLRKMRNGAGEATPDQIKAAEERVQKLRAVVDQMALGETADGGVKGAARSTGSKSGVLDPQRWGGNITRQGRATAFLAKPDEPKAIINNSLINLLWKQYGFDSREDMVRAFDVLSERNPAFSPDALIEAWFRDVSGGDPKARDSALQSARAALR